MSVIISDLDVIELVAGTNVIGGAGNSTQYQDYLKSRINLSGNYATSSFEAVALGNNTFTDGYAIARVTSGSSISSGSAIAASNK
ncbi:MAG: hypothetical protein KME64_22990 [Scytonematopsis contorta HA4267-MV1]|jgi:hypothetical protein|nr:hypothetical protein [Scytonematopsis contorta HA4267-MV1]